MRKPRFVLLAALSWAAGIGGCTRCFYRNRADKEVTCILEQKDQYPDWKIEQYHVYPDPRARFADPTCPDRPPMPPDDPAAACLSPNPQNPGKAGVANIEGTGYLELLQNWDAQNRAEAESATREKSSSPPKEKTDNSAATNYTATSLMTEPKEGQKRPFLIKLEQAVELGLINSREFQDAREDLYLTALPVTLERFAFAPQFFAVAQALREAAGAETVAGGAGAGPVGPSNDWSIRTNTGVAQLFSTGALLLVNFANQTVVNLTGAARGVVSQSTINLDLVQPLLRGGGLAVTLEPLTQVERNLLYEIRAFARFRKTFFVAIAGGGGGSITGGTFQPQNVIASNNFSPTSGFGASRVLPGFVAPVTAPLTLTGNEGLQVTPGTSGILGLQTALNAPVSGYLSTLLEAAQIQVDKYNIQKLEGFLRYAQALLEIGDLSQLQVDQFEQQLLSGRRNLLNDQQDYLQTIDQFKLQLGVPPCIPLELDDSPFRPLNEQFQRFEALFNDYKATSEEAVRFSAPERLAQVRGELRRLLLTSGVVRGTRFRTEIETRWAAWEKLPDKEIAKRLSGLLEQRRQLLDRKADQEAKGQALSTADQRKLDRVNNELELGQFEQALRLYESQPWKALPTKEGQRREQQRRYSDVVQAFIIILTQARNERMQQLHDQWPKLKRLCVNGVDLMKVDLAEGEAAAAQYALLHRLDLMNVRAQLVDAWRQLAVFANALLGVFNVQYHMDTTTPAGLGTPLAFSGSRTHHQLIFNGELPIVRLEERNNYRASLIQYQRARRILQRAEDQVMYDVRQELILLRQQEEIYRIQARQVELGYMTVENALDTFAAPPGGLLPGQQPPDPATRAAALTTQLINAQNSLYTAQFTLTSIWITYLNTRLQLYRDMELMPLDARGVWIDNVETCECPSEEKSGASSETPAGDGDRLPEPRPVELPEAK